MELGNLARSRILASEDSIAGPDQKAVHYKQTILDKFKSIAPAAVSEKGYGIRKQKSVVSKYDAAAAEIQKFRASLHFISAKNPTRVTEDEILSMVIAENLGKPDVLSY